MPKFKVRIDAVFIKEVEADTADDARDLANDEWTMDDYVETGEILVFDESGGLADDEDEDEGFVEPVGPAPIPPPAFTDEEKADMKHNAQMLDGCETADEINAELRAQTQGN